MHTSPKTSVLKTSIAKIYRISLLTPCVLAAAPAFAATMLDFEGLPHNTDIPSSFADFATTNSTGFTVSSGIQGFVGTPNIDILWPGADHLQSYSGWNP